MKHLLLTGATGMLGGYLLRDALVARRPLAVLVRSKPHESAAFRVEAILAHWEGELGRRLPRPVVLEGDMGAPALGLSPRDRNWLGEHCDSVLHSAASIRFQPHDRTGEPFRSNVEGTRNLLEVCREARVRRYAHISTAYVCSSLGGLAREDELIDPQSPGRNVYERSKIQAETLVRAAEHFDRVTILRPSIIVGDSQTGFASGFHTIYTPLRLGFLHALSKLSAGWEFDARLAAEVAETSFLCGLGLTGDERKNLVPVDWVAAAALALVERQTARTATFHLTNPESTPLTVVAQTMLDSVIEFVNTGRVRPAGLPASLFESDQYREQMQVYAGHIGDDGEFDSRVTEATIPQLPCPATNPDALRRMWSFALHADFKWQPPRPPAGVYELGELLARLPSFTRADEVLQVDVPGPGGGAWLVGFEAGRPVAAHRGMFPETRQTVYAAASALEKLGNGETSVSKLVAEGKMGIAGDDPQRIATVLVPALADWLTSTNAARCSPQPLAAPVAGTQRM